MKFIDLFAGIGGFHLGLNYSTLLSPPKKGKFYGFDGEPKYKYKCVYANEWDKYANSIYRKHFGKCDTRDIRSVLADSIPDHDLLCAGFPCQAFSIAGKRRGFEDTRGTLFFEIARILEAKRPRLLLLENVKGLLSHDNGKTFSTIIRSLDELGYDLQWQVLNSKNFGVPQNRERVFIIGNLRGTPRPKVFPVGKTSEANGKMELRYDSARQVSPAVRTPSGGYHTPTVSYAIDSNYWKGTNYKDYKKKHRRQLVEMPMKIRRLTPIECERLQGFPDNWTEGISDTQRYKCLGNAVTVNVIEYLGKSLALPTKL